MAVYLDNSATTRVRDEVIEAMQPYLCDKWGNPSSIHKMGRQARGAVETARQQIADLIHADPSEIYFTPCGTYSNNVTLLGRARYVEENNLGRHFITSCIEHSSGIGPAKHLASRGWKVTYLHVDKEGFVDLDELRETITPETSMISLMYANNEVGTVQPTTEIAAIAEKHGIYYHTDAVQAAGKMPIDVQKLPVQTMSLSGHKFHAPKGIGILYIRKGAPMLPIIFGGGQERGIFPGTENLGSIVAIGKAAEIAAQTFPETAEKLKKIQRMMIDRLTQVPEVKLTGAHDIEKRVPGHVSIIVQGTVGEQLVNDADFKGICISSVSACSSAGADPSHVLSCIGYPREEVTGSARITAGAFNTFEECEKAANTLADVFAKRAAKNKVAAV
ncbi:MAG TPA: cysteine desulfurase family protein [Drouetiella sp.]